MQSWIIDDLGQIYRSGSGELRQALGNPSSASSTYETYAIENIGAIGIRQRKERIHIQFRPALVSEKAFSALMYWFLDNGAPEVAVSWFDELWHVERPMAHSVAVPFLGYLMDQRTLSSARAQPRLLRRTSTYARQRWQKVATVIQSKLENAKDLEEVCTILDNACSGRWMFVDIELPARNARMIRRGGGYPPICPGLMGPDKGFDLRQIHDKTYRDWVLEDFCTVAASGNQQFDDIDALVEWPRIGDTRTRYWRVIAPVARGEGWCRVLSVSGSDSSIDLRPNLIQIPA